MWVSIVTLTEYYPAIWTDLSLPTGLNKQDLINRICIDCGELEMLYSDPDILKYMIRNWSRTEAHVWEKLADTLDLQYNPIYNLDVTWEETRTPNITRQKSGSITDNRTPNITERRTPDLKDELSAGVKTTETPTNFTNTESVQGFNSSTWEDARKNTQSGSNEIAKSGKDTTTRTGTETTLTTGTDKRTTTTGETDKETGTETISTRRYGNQGVTMTQDMIQKERDISMFNLYEYICRSFKNRFCLMVY